VYQVLLRLDQWLLATVGRGERGEAASQARSVRHRAHHHDSRNRRLILRAGSSFRWS